MTAKLRRARAGRVWTIGAPTALLMAMMVGIVFAVSAASGAGQTVACASSDVLTGSTFEIDAIVPPPASAKKGTLPTKGANLAGSRAQQPCRSNDRRGVPA